ncbi:MAG: alpha/beta hydrolase [Deltaproteobacteria bacterium]|jgi:pimeloyl-ACP methyl ester carboxylesterase|nr:alpha/beta hydrolase [Deltaproteobacteria bacterium]
MSEVLASDGVRLYAEATGSGTPLVLSPGYCQTHENFRAQVEPLAAAGYRVVLWDYRGHGKSEVPESEEAYSMAQVVDDLGRVLAWAAPGEPAVVGGLSFGGLASQHFALDHPERVAALLLIASGPGFKNPKAQAGWEAQVGRIAGRLERVGFEGYTSGRAAPNSIGLKPDLPAARSAGRAIEAQDAHGMARFGRRVTAPAPSTIERLGAIEAPALVLVGSLDAAYQAASEVMTARLPHAERVVIEDAGHCVNIEQTEAFNRAVLDFLSRNLPAGAKPTPR